MGGGYALTGNFNLNLHELSDFSFIGHGAGSNCQIKGISFETISADLQYTPQGLTVSDLSITDRAGALFANQLTLKRAQQETWHLSLDKMSLKDLRFSRLKSPWTRFKGREKSLFRSLVIPTFVLENVSGNINELKTLEGSGKVEFTNLPKKTFLSSLLFLPTEITARIGLDLTTLIPVRGTIEYEIREGKVNFKEFKEMYSDGKRSRFYLAAGTEAFIDFKGNLNMKVKMKQYSLLMKLAELLTISVKGTLLHPSYTFSNHVDAEDPF